MNGKGSFNINSEVKKTVKDVEGRKIEEFEAKDVYHTSSETKFLTGYNGTTTEARFNNKGVCKLWTNWGAYVTNFFPVQF